jgi:hypothetical protein
MRASRDVSSELFVPSFRRVQTTERSHFAGGDTKTQKEGNLQGEAIYRADGQDDANGMHCWASQQWHQAGCRTFAGRFLDRRSWQVRLPDPRG